MVLTYLHFRILEFPLIFGWMIMNVHIIYCIYRDRLCSLWPGATEPWLLGGSPSQDRQKKCPPTDTTIFSESLRIARQSRPVPFLDKSIVLNFLVGFRKRRFEQVESSSGRSDEMEHLQTQREIKSSSFCAKIGCVPVPSSWVWVLCQSAGWVLYIYTYIYRHDMYIYIYALIDST